MLANVLKNRCSFVNVNSYNVDFKQFSITTNTKYDLIIDATDNLETRVLIDNFSKQQNIPWIYGSVESFHGQVCFFQNASFESLFNISKHIPDGIAAPIVMNIASLQSNLAIRYLTNLSLKKDFLYYCFFNNDGIFQTQTFNLPTS